MSDVLNLNVEEIFASKVFTFGKMKRGFQRVCTEKFGG